MPLQNIFDCQSSIDAHLIISRYLRTSPGRCDYDLLACMEEAERRVCNIPPHSSLSCTAAPCAPVSTHAEMAAVVSSNTASANALMAGQLFIDTGDDGAPAKGLEEGMPIRWGNKPVTIPCLPNRDDLASKTCCHSAAL